MGLYNAFEFMIYAWHKEYKGMLNLVLVGLIIVSIVSVFIIYKRSDKEEIKEKYSKLLWIMGIYVITLVGYALGVAIGLWLWKLCQQTYGVGTTGSYYGNNMYIIQIVGRKQEELFI